MSETEEDLIRAGAARIIALGPSAKRLARDPVNLPMVNNWVEAIGDPNPVYVAADAAQAAGFDGPVAPPAMIQVWTMGRLGSTRTTDDPLGLIINELDQYGFTSIVATNCEQTYHRYVRHGEQLSVTTVLDNVVGPKKTGLGEGWFITTRNVWYSGDEPVAEMLFRVLKFKPGTGAPPPVKKTDVLRPVISLDTEFFWEGTAAGELRIQRCTSCGALRHPPGPFCMSCGADKPDYIVASGAGTVFSYVVHHHPKVPGKKLPFVVAVVELAEGVRMIGELVDVDPSEVTVGMPVESALIKIDDELTLPMWRPAAAATVAPEPIAATDTRPVLTTLTVEATPTFVVSTALATRDFQDVHHDRDSAIARGSKDIFLNILTDTGLVQRVVAQWAGDAARFKSIAIRLGVPCYAYDKLELSVRELSRDGDVVTVEVSGRDSLGEHLSGTVVLELPA